MLLLYEHFGQRVNLFSFDLCNPCHRIKLLIVAVQMLLLIQKYPKLTQESLIFPFRQLSWTGLGHPRVWDENRFYFAATGVLKLITKLPAGVDFDSWKKIYSFLKEDNQLANTNS